MIEKGRIKYMLQPQEVSPTFRKAEIVIETDAQYPQIIKFDLHQDNCKLLEGKQIGQMVEIKFDIRGKEYNNPQKGIQVFNTLVAWQVNVMQ